MLDVKGTYEGDTSLMSRARALVYQDNAHPRKLPCPRYQEGRKAERRSKPRVHYHTVIADEPIAGLDVSVQVDVPNLMKELQARLGLAYVIVTHNLPVIRHVSEWLAIMYLGRLVEQGPTAEGFARPAHQYTLGLVNAVPEPDPDRRRETLELAGEIPSLRHRPRGCEFHTRCPFVQDRCRAEASAYRPIAADRWVRCHFPLTDADATRDPRGG